VTSVVFSTPGLIPIEAFTVFGMNAKPNSTNPFGFFGTGLKIAIAVCLRMNQEVVIWRGKDKYTFYTRQQDFRGKEFARIRMKKETATLSDRLLGRPSYHELPFTTELGKHWELWQAFREFQTNTMDENGVTFIASLNSVQGPRGKELESLKEQPESSHIVVTGQKFVDEYHDRDRNFLPDGLTVREGSEKLQVLDRPSKHVYYRGVRVMDLKEEAKYTYNFLNHIDLTEDRTAKYPFLLESWICEHIMQSKDEKFVEDTVGRSSSGYERSLGYRYTDVRPSATFVSVASSSPNPAAKAKAVEASAPIVPTTRITIIVPRSEVTDEELQMLEDAVSNVFGAVTVEKQG
jgi:hypothetical protein